MIHTTQNAKLLVENAVSYLSIEKRLSAIQVEVYNPDTDNYEIVSNNLTENLNEQLNSIVATAAKVFKVSTDEIVSIINLVADYGTIASKIILSKGFDYYENKYLKIIPQ
jgi:translation initiation factor 6 (eIF-6)